MYQARSYSASQLPSVGYIPDSFGRSFDQSQQALAGRTQRQYSLAGNNAANQIGGSGGAAYKSLLNAQGANAGALANIDALTQRQGVDLQRQSLALQGGVAQNDANQAAWNATTADRQYGAGLDQNQSQYQSTLGENRRQFDTQTRNQVDQFGRTLGENSRQFNVNSANQVDQFGRQLNENSREYNLGQQGNIFQSVISNLTSNGFDALSNLPPELAGLLQNYLGSGSFGGTGTGTSSGTTGGSAPAWKPTSGNKPTAPASGAQPPPPSYAPPPSYGPATGSGTAPYSGYGVNPYAPRTQNGRRY